MALLTLLSLLTLLLLWALRPHAAGMGTPAGESPVAHAADVDAGSAERVGYIFAGLVAVGVAITCLTAWCRSREGCRRDRDYRPIPEMLDTPAP